MLIAPVMETWKNVPGYNGKYQASDFGRIRSYINGKHRVLSQGTKNGAGYLQVTLGNSNDKKFLHRVIAETFCEKGDITNPVVNHLDGNKLNNNASNLEWTTYKKNTTHSRISLKSKGKIQNIDTVKSILIAFINGHRVTDIAKQYSQTRQSVSGIITGRFWSEPEYEELFLLRKLAELRFSSNQNRHKMF